MNIFNGIAKGIRNNLPGITMTAGIGLMLGGTVTAVAATPKAYNAIQERKEAEKKDSLSLKETLQTVWKYYILPFGLEIVGGVCIVGGQKQQIAFTTAAMTAYDISERQLVALEKNTRETIGDKKTEEIIAKCDQSVVDATPLRDEEIIRTYQGETLCLDAISGRYFFSSPQFIKRAENKFNKRMVRGQECYSSLNDWYYGINLPSIPVGDYLGFNAEKGMLDVRFSSELVRGDKPCLVVNYKVYPEYNYERLSVIVPDSAPF